MPPNRVKPRAREGLLSADHSKRGRRFVTIVSPEMGRVTLLEPWEHGILVLCDGSREAGEIARLMAEGLGDERVDEDAVHRCLKFFERQELIEPAGLRSKEAIAAPSPKTLAGLQEAYREWHKDPLRTGQILSGILPSPFGSAGEPVPIGLGPTVALPGEEARGTQVRVGGTLFLGPARAEAETLVGPLAGSGGRAAPAAMASGPPAAPATESEDIELDRDVSELLRAVDDDFARFEEASPKTEGAPAQGRCPRCRARVELAAPRCSACGFSPTG